MDAPPRIDKSGEEVLVARLGSDVGASDIIKCRLLRGYFNKLNKRSFKFDINKIGELTYRLTEDSSVATQTCSISGVKQRRNTGAEVSQRSVRCSGFLRSVIQTLLSLPDDNTVLKASLVCDNVDNKLRSLSRIIRCKNHDKGITWSVQTPSSCILIVDMHLCWPSDQRRTVPSELAERH